MKAPLTFIRTKNFLQAICLLTAISCSHSQKDHKAVEEFPETKEIDTSIGAQLSAAQKAEGWKLLFDGKSLAGWKIFKDKANGTWEISDGTLHSKPFDSRTITEHADLITTEEFENFELLIDWKIVPKANTGVMYRVTEEFKEPYFSGPEFQIVDDNGYGELAPTNTTGGVYGMYIPQHKIVKPIGQWNTTRIKVSGNAVEQWLNGNQVVTYELGSPDWLKRKSGSKWNDASGYGNAKKGGIDLQDHGDEAWFKNILIRVL